MVNTRIESTVLQSRMAVLQNENRRLRDKYNEITKESKKLQIESQGTINENLKQIDKLNESLEQSEVGKAKLEKECSDQGNQSEEKYNTMHKKLTNKILELTNQIETHAEQAEKFDKFENEKRTLVDQNHQLNADLEKEKKDRFSESQEKEREKIQATEKLRKEMLYKIKETKANLLALNDEQLQTTTRLTILQNHQLTTELEYQSKQTE